MLNAKLEPSLPSGSLRPAGRQTLNTWQAVQAEVLRRIRSGRWKAGQLIPTEHQLADELGCARATVNRALSQLAQDGIVQRRRRVGTRVAATSVPDAGAEATPIRDEVEATGATYAYHLTGRDVVRATPEVMSIMHVTRAEPLIRYRALITADDAPYCVEVGYLAPQDYVALTDEMIRDAEPLEWMRRVVPQLSGRLEILATRLTAECAEELGAEKGFPVLTLDRTLWSDGRALSHSRRVYPPGHRASFVR
ncbi:MAG TPA: GntR family transcriptional regulator [Paracoccus sp. (in: a-proteobacteria)]|uniref:GntR family transcriptional regulator n=1 Tax=uncultured Paracoccus sp. TaxID=189685 RepID=UPI00262F29FF|nr:GntR family transcriptional regulator [uncultured Paracoccus sp.]HMQ39863.1 GntR family transcriptional regulator [Paracoccus sp. (in: a-proteobacteria)]HMR35736.1 GntR family transcriptional regulator [Paracoccus sp. (in: a-proteobacteria)]